MILNLRYQPSPKRVQNFYPCALQLQFLNECPEGRDRASKWKTICLELWRREDAIYPRCWNGATVPSPSSLASKRYPVFAASTPPSKWIPSQIIPMLSLHAVHFISDSAEISGEIACRVCCFHIQHCAEESDCFVKHQPGMAGLGWAKLFS